MDAIEYLDAWSSSNSTAASRFAGLYQADAGLGGPPSLETCIILGLGVLIGSVVMGITGFGTAILHLSTWAIAGALGFNPGPLKLAVITCGCGMTLSMLPMFFLAQATTHAIKPLAISIPLGKAIAAPLGALLLKVLPARQLEAFVSVLMVLIMVIMNRSTIKGWAVAAVSWLGPSQAAYTCHRPIRKGKGAPLPRGSAVASSASSLSRLYREADELRLPLVHNVDSDAQLLEQNPDAESAGEEDGEEDSSTSSCSSDEQDDHDFLHKEPLMPDGVILIQVNNSPAASPSTQPPSPSAAAWRAAAGPDGPEHVSRSSSEESLVREEAAVLKHGFWGLIAIGAVTGLSAGFLTGATGIGGPPMMVMYAYLDVSKAAVRGTNSVMSLVQDQVIGYFVFGLIRWEDRFAYLAGATAGLVGCLIGHSVQKLMDQKQFSRVMTGLLLLCFCLMTASAAGWINVY